MHWSTADVEGKALLDIGRQLALEIDGDHRLLKLADHQHCLVHPEQLIGTRLHRPTSRAALSLRSPKTVPRCAANLLQSSAAAVGLPVINRGYTERWRVLPSTHCA